MRAALEALCGRSARGSRLALTYMNQRAFDRLPGAVALTAVFFRALGEPLRGRYLPDEAARVLAEASFSVCSDSGSSDRRRTYGARTPLLRLFDSERLALAERA